MMATQEENAMDAVGPHLHIPPVTRGILVPDPIKRTKASGKNFSWLWKRVLMTFFLFSACSLLAMYINILNSIPEFVDEAGNSTIEVSAHAVLNQNWQQITV